MEVVRLGPPGFWHMHSKIYLPSLSPPNSTKKPRTLNAVNSGLNNFSANKWADRLISDLHFLPDVNSTATTTALNHPPYPNPPAVTPPDRLVNILFTEYSVSKIIFLDESFKRCYENRVSKPPQYDYNQHALFSRNHCLSNNLPRKFIWAMGEECMFMWARELKASLFNCRLGY